MIPRYRAIETILLSTSAGDLLVSTTGMISREVFATDDRPGNFYMLGSMGLLSSFGLGLALLTPSRRVLVLEGDGSALMNLGALPLIATEHPGNLVHVILDNEAYESTGAQPSLASSVNLTDVAESCGYARVCRVDDAEDLAQTLRECTLDNGPSLLHVKVAIVPVEGIPRVSHVPSDIRDRFRNHIRRPG